MLGMAIFWGWLHASGFVSVLEKALPHRMPRSSNNLTLLEKVLVFCGVACVQGAQAHACGLPACGQPIYPVPAFCAGFSGVAANANYFRLLWSGTMNHLPSSREGYTLDWNSAKLLHRGGNQ